ncbi:DNA-formamidopyrimidine glycosylase family protein [Actinomadura xylanilytica]|uniref:DNA-formamidopyrimidine glycosylase family protein n=1 Tax=Actinomadura xylanilytica TaxID=887459 RepID=UPI00255B39DB|nr:DNA-formamidopyrimidine glycosylase family protein [Actinomadura xylanilytica]MDL4771452.1 DNA-formamidopyrimidine glycosylase family protein [Actinomadura xylanilytica]
MPEGDVVWLAARRLHEALAGRPLTRSDFRVPRLAATDLRGRTVREAVPRGKHLLVRVEGGFTVHTHLLMEGRWQIRRAGPPPRDHRVRLILANAEWQAVGYSLGVVELLRTADEAAAVGHLGPDLLDPGWGPALAAEAVRRLGERPGRAVGEALLDQSGLAGIGNVYKAEILFLRGVHPWTPVGEVNGLPDLVELSHRLLDANKERHGHVTTGDLRRGHTHWVYGRAGRPCRRCGTPIQRAGQPSDAGERVTYWCPRCQPAP